MVGNINGTIAFYDVPAVITNTFNLIDADVNSINEGGQSTAFFEDVNNDGKRDLFVGNGSGGLSFFSSLNQFVGINEKNTNQLLEQITLFPNPANNYLTIRINEIEFEKGSLILYNIIGEKVDELIINSNSQTFKLNDTSKGIYFATISLTSNGQNKSITKKIIIE